MQTQHITKRQALLVLITIIIGGVLQPVFRNLLLESGNGAWAPIILATLFGMLLLFLTVRLAGRFPNESAADYLPRIFGRPIGYLLVLLFLGAFLLKASYLLRHVSEFFVAAVLPETPISAVMGVLLLLVYAGILAELEGIVRFNQLVLPLIITAIALVSLLSLPKCSGWYLLPLFSKGFGGFFNALSVAAGYLSHLVLLLFLYPLIVDREQMLREGLKTLAISGSIFLGIYLNITLTLGAKLGSAFTWPYLAVVENVPVGIERMEALFMVIWFLAAFVAITLFVYVVALGLHQLFPPLKRHWVGLASLPVVAYLAIASDNQPTAVLNHLLVNRYALYLFAATPLLSLMVAAWRHQGGGQLE